MKNLCLCLILTSFFASCDVDATGFDVIERPETIVENLHSLNRFANDSIENSNNPYDYSGQLFSEILGTYYATRSEHIESSSLVREVDEIALSIVAFTAIQSTSYQMASPERVDYFVSQKNTCMTSILNDSGLSAPAKKSLLAFIDDYIRLCSNEAHFSTIYNCIVSYETAVINHSDFTEMDKEILLVTTSIARYSAAVQKKKPKKNTDPAWEFLICTLYGSIEGANRSPSEAITLAVSSGIAENQ